MGVVKRQGITAAFFQYFGLIISFVNGVFLFPRIVGTDILGFTQWLMAVVNIFTIFSGLGIVSITTRYFPVFRTNDKRHGGYFMFATLFTFIGIILSTIIVLLFKDGIINYFSKDSSVALVTQFYYLIVPALILAGYSEYLFSYSKSLLRTRVPTAINELFGKFANTVLLIAFYYSLIDLRWFLILFVMKIGLKVLAHLTYIRWTGNLSLKVSKEIISSGEFKPMLRFGMFTLMSGVGIVLVNYMDTLMLSFILDFQKTGIYAIIMAICAVITMPYSAMANIVSPLIAAAWQKQDVEEVKTLYQKTSINNIIIGGFIYLLIVINASNILELIGPEFKGNENLIYILASTKLAFISFGINGSVLMFSKFYRYDIVLKILLIGLTVGTNYIFIPIFGLTGAGLATLITIFLNNGLISLLIYVKNKIHPFTRQTIKTGFIGALTLAICVVLPALDFWLLDAIYRSIVCGILFIGMVLIFNCSPDITSTYHQIIRRVRSLI